MARIAVSRDMALPRRVVWPAIADLGSHAEWMRDARSIVFQGEQRRGVGTRMEVETVVGPLRTVDVMEVVGWDEGHFVEVEHRGLVKGRGVLSVSESGDQTRVSWAEELAFPWWLGGAVTAWLARPVLAAMWRGNLRRLEESLTMRGDDPPQTPRRPTAG
jgi:hypothetical protein